MSRKSAVVAIGGNSLIKDKQHQSVRDQYIAAGETCWHVASMIKDGWDVAIGHGNGPQVGFILRRSELAAHELHEVPLDVCGADSQGAIGYALAQNLENDFHRLDVDRHAVAVVTGPDGHLHGVAAVIDKDFASSLLASRIGADTFIISTAVDRVALNWGQPNQEWLDRMTAAEARAWLAEGGHFMPGSMAPKIEACLQFLDGGGHRAIITRPELLERALHGHAGTLIEA